MGCSIHEFDAISAVRLGSVKRLVGKLQRAIELAIPAGLDYGNTDADRYRGACLRRAVADCTPAYCATHPIREGRLPTCVDPDECPVVPQRSTDELGLELRADFATGPAVSQLGFVR